MVVAMEPWLLVAASTVLAWLLARATHHGLGFVTQVESVSMAPTLAPGQRLLARRPHEARPLRRGDIVVVDSPELDRPVIKRVVGLPGEHIDVGADGRVRIAGHDLVEPYLVHRGGRPGAFQVPDGHLLLLGDNRARSSDARAWREPYLPLSAVMGRVVQFRWSRAGGAGRRRRQDPDPCTAGPDRVHLGS